MLPNETYPIAGSTEPTSTTKGTRSSETCLCHRVFGKPINPVNMMSGGGSSTISSRSKPSTINTTAETMSTTSESLRTRNKRKDDAIRRKVEQELSRKRTPQRKPSTMSLKARIKIGTVASLKPAPALTVLENARIAQVAQLMASKRADAVLVVNSSGLLSGILTDKDIAYRVVAEGLDMQTTTVMHVMTPNPIHVFDKDKASDALAIMTERRFRHLPVISQANSGDNDDLDESSVVASDVDSSTNVVGLLDITKCVFDKLQDLERKVNEDSNIILAMEALERRGSLASDQVDSVKAIHGCPNLSHVISTLENAGHLLPEISVRGSVRDAARIMKERHSTAVLVLNHAKEGNNEYDKLAGIFTTKDVVLRVLASNLDPNTTTTPHPDSCTPQTTILDALKKLHVGHYLHLPILDGEVPVGLVDVQQLTMAMLEYLVMKQDSTANPSESGPMWGKFWSSALVGSTSIHDDEDDSNNSDYSGVPGQQRRRNSRSPSVLSLTNPPPQSMIPLSTTSSTRLAGVIEDGIYSFKIRHANRVSYLSTDFNNYNAFVKAVVDKVGDGGPFRQPILYHLDDEGDRVCIESAGDLREAVAMARRNGSGKVCVFVEKSGGVGSGGAGELVAFRNFLGDGSVQRVGLIVCLFGVIFGVVVRRIIN